MVTFCVVMDADVAGCACDPARPETMRARECSLCNEAESQPVGKDVFLLKDVNPRKPNRWLALPRAHARMGHPMHELPPDLQTRIWKAAIAKGKELWGDGWGLAYNGTKVRTQCHGHVHIGKLLSGLAPGNYIDVAGPEQIRIPGDDAGIWVHPVGNKLRVHHGEQITETTLLR
ncbi:MAG: hypothetical protein JJE04_26330 [Acidobacteriia bacterium]|nr:hypothetical protein [Terriglobia bacterium]